MKKLIALFIVIMCSTYYSCSSDETAGVSKVTNYPTITLNGDALIVIVKGQTYNELGAIALAGSQTLPLVTESSVNTSVPGVYKVNYKSTNNDGFDATNTRTIVVLSDLPSTINLEGTFLRNGTNVNNVIKLSDRKYSCDNATGYTTGDPNNIKLTFYNIDDQKIYAPFQEEASLTGISAESSIGTITSANRFSWVIFASGFFGTATRTFIRQ